MNRNELKWNYAERIAKVDAVMMFKIQNCLIATSQSLFQQYPQLGRSQAQIGIFPLRGGFHPLTHQPSDAIAAAQFV